MSRPEHTGPPEIVRMSLQQRCTLTAVPQFYDETEAGKYASSSRMMDIQTQLSERALELLALPDEPCYILDVGCGSGLSGDCITEAGHEWTGIDISKAMLDVAVDREVDGDCVLGDMGAGLPFRAGVFDGAISISALQWLCNADRSTNMDPSNADPKKRLLTFFTSLYHCLNRGGKAVLQWYPENPQQIEMVNVAAMKTGFTGGLLVDYPHSTKAKKYYMVLFAGSTGVAQPMPQALGVEDDGIGYSADRMRNNKKRGKPEEGAAMHREWVKHKKQRQRIQGREVRPDSKYTGRKRGPKF